MNYSRLAGAERIALKTAAWPLRKEWVKIKEYKDAPGADAVTGHTLEEHHHG